VHSLVVHFCAYCTLVWITPTLNFHMSPEIFLSFNEIFSLIVIVDLCIEFVGMILVCLHSELHMYNHKGSLLLLN